LVLEALLTRHGNQAFDGFCLPCRILLHLLSFLLRPRRKAERIGSCRIEAGAEADQYRQLRCAEKPGCHALS